MQSRLNEESETYKKVLEIETLMNQHEITITGNNLKLIVNNKEYNIGRDSDCFPRFLDEPFWR
jgi:hypothetical protein